MKIIKPCIAIAVFLLAGKASPFVAQQAGSEDRRDEAKFAVETGLVEIRAIVTDREGRIVEGLGKDDFELLENELPREISHFSVSRVEENQRFASAESGETLDRESKLRQMQSRLNRPPVRTILVYVDSRHLTFSNIDWVKRTLGRFIDKQLTDRDLVAFTSSESLGVAQQFTRDRNILKYAVEQIRYSPGSRTTLFTPRLAAEYLDERTGALRVGIDIMRQEENMVCPCSLLQSYAYQKATQVLTEASCARENTLSILEHYADQMADLPGKRIIIIFSDGFTLYSRIGGTQSSEIEMTVGRAARSGVAIYAIDAKGLQGPPLIDAARSSSARDAMYETMVRCLKNCDQIADDDERSDCQDTCLLGNPLSLSCLQDIGNYNNPICDYPDPGELEDYLETARMEKSNGLHTLAFETGGKMYENNNDLNLALEKVLEDNRFFYVLSYYIKTPKADDHFRRVAVRVRNHPEYTVRAPRGFWPSHVRERLESAASETPQQQLIRAMSSPLPVADLGVSVRADFIETENDDKQVSLAVYFEGDSFQYRENETGSAVALEVLSVIYDSSGNRVEGTSAHIEGTLSSKNLELFKARGYRFLSRLALEPGAYQVRIGVREEGRDLMGTATAWVEVPEISPDRLEMSSLILSNPLDLDLMDSEGVNLNNLEEVRFIQGIPMYEKDDIFYYTFRVHPGEQDPDGAGLQLMKELLVSGEPFRKEPWKAVSEKNVGMDSKGWLDLDGELDIHTLKPGVYELRIILKNGLTKQPVQRSVAFGIL